MAAKGRYSEACPLFEKSHQLEPALGALLNLADCFEKEGKLASAFLSFNQAAEWAHRNGEGKREEVARGRAQALKPRLGLVSVELSAGVAAQVAEVRPASAPGSSEPMRQWSLDGSPQSVPMDPGAYELTARAADGATVSVPFEITATPGTVRVKVPALIRAALAESAPAHGSATAVRTPDAGIASRRGSGASLRVPALVTLVAGAAMLAAGAGGVIYGKLVIDRVARQQPGMPDYLNPTVTRSEFERVQVLYPASFVAVGVGAALIITSVVLFLVGRPSEPQVALLATDRGAAALLQGCF